MRIFFFSVLFFCSSLIYPDTALSFNDAARLAVENSFELQNEFVLLALREGAWAWGIRAYMPRLSLMASQDDRLSLTGPDSFLKNYSLNVEQLVWDGGRLALSRRVERAELELAESQLEQLSLELAERAVGAYRDVLHGRMLVEIKSNTLDFLNEQLTIMRREAELGLIRPRDLTEAEITVALQELEFINLSIDLQEAERKLYTGLGLDELPLLSEQIDTQRAAVFPLLSNLLPLLEHRNPDLAALRFSVARMEAEVKAYSLSWLPNIRLTGSFGLSGNQYPLSRYNWSVGILLDFSTPWLSGNLGTSAAWEPPFDRSARLQQTLSPVQDPASSFSPRAANLALAQEQYKYEAALIEAEAALERLIGTCLLLERRRALAAESLKLERERYHYAEIRLSLGDITRIELMESRLEYEKKEAALVEAAVMVLGAERELEKFLNLNPGEIYNYLELSI